MAIEYTQNLEKAFSYKGMRNLMSYLGTFNCESQVVAIDANTEDIQTTGTKLAMINGQPHALAADAALDISACTEGTETAWATATSYSVGDIRKNSEDTRYMCIVAHTSSSTNEPGLSEESDTYWEQRKHGATNASGTSITAAYDQWFIILAKSTGVISIWEAGDEAATGTAVCKVPHYDPKIYCPVGFLHIANGTGSAFVVGTTGLDTASVTDTFYQVTGPVFPHSDNWDVN